MIRAQFLPAILLTLAFAILFGFLFPIFIWIFGQALFPYQANGSIKTFQEKQIGSELLGQNFSAEKYFHPRPSAAGAGYDPTGSSGTNLGPTSKKLFSGIQDDPSTEGTDESYLGVEGLAKAYRIENGLAPNVPVPVDAVTRSASGLDPDISIQNSHLQAKRVAHARGMKVRDLYLLIEHSTWGRFLGIFGEPRVNVLLLNLALDEQAGK